MTRVALCAYQLLFKAYNASVLPQNIDPFNVDAYSPDQELSHLLFKISGKNSMTEFGHFGQSDLDHGKDVFFDLDDVLIPAAGVYIWEPKRKVSAEHRIKNWHSFKNRIEALAA